MHEIICPHCGKAFKIDEAGYADILKQVRDSEFEQQLHERLELAEQDKRNAIELAKNEVGSEMQKATAAKDTEIQKLKAQLDAGEVAQKLAVTEALSTVEKERDELAFDEPFLADDDFADFCLRRLEQASNPFECHRFGGGGICHSALPRCRNRARNVTASSTRSRAGRPRRVTSRPSRTTPTS